MENSYDSRQSTTGTELVCIDARPYHVPVPIVKEGYTRAGATRLELQDIVQHF